MSECGLAALASLMSVYGVDVPLDRLRDLAASTLYGTNLRTLCQVAMRFGFDARPRRIHAVTDLAPIVPCLVHLDFIHFAVVEAIDAREVLLSDPMAGTIRMPIAQFGRSFTGIALTLRPTKFLARGSPISPPSRYGLLVRRDVYAGSALGMGSGIMLAGAAIMAGNAADNGTTILLPIGALAAAVVLAMLAIRLIAQANTYGATERQAACIASVAAQPAAAFVLRSPAQLVARLMAPGAMVDALLTDAVLAAAILPPLMIGAILASPGIGVAGCAMIAAEFALIVAFVVCRGARVAPVQRQALPVRAPHPHELVHADNWSLGRGGETMFRALAGTHASAAASAIFDAERGALLSAIRAAAAAMRLAVVVAIGVALHRSGLPAGGLAASALLVMTGGGQLARIAAGLRTPRLTGALYRDADHASLPAAIPPAAPPAGTALVFDQVAWRPAVMLPDVVTGISFAIPSATSLALIGPPRSGGTTIARLAAGWLTPTAGRLTATPAILLGTDWCLGHGTIRDVLSQDGGFDDAAMTAMIDALGLATAFAPRGGLALYLSDGAPEISGGQRRRLMLAAALLRQPALLILDGTLEAIGTPAVGDLLDLCRTRGSAVLLAGHRGDIAALCDARLDLGLQA